MKKYLLTRFQKIKTKGAHYNINSKDIFFLIILIICTLFIVELPYITGKVVSSEQSHFIGVSPQAPGDYMIYYNFIEQSKRGAFLFSNFFTSESHQGLYFSPFWMILGKIASPFSLSTESIYEIAKLFFGAIGIIATFLFIKRLFKDRKLTYFATIAAIFSGGVSVFFGAYTDWVIHVVNDTQGLFYPLDMYVSEGFLVTLFGHSGLFALSFTLFISVLWIYISNKTSFIRNFSLVFLPFVLSLIHSYDMITLFTTLGFFTLFKVITKQKITHDIKKVSFIIIGAGPGIIYLLTLFFLDPVIGGWVKQNVVEMPLLFPSLVGLGALVPLALFAGYKSFQQKNEKLILLFIWVFSALLLAFSPFPFQRKLIQGISFPLGILSSASIYYFFQSTKKIQKKVIAYTLQGALITGTIVLLFISQPYTTIYETLYYSQAIMPYFISKETTDALSFITKNTTTNDIILASPVHAQFIPGLYYRKSYFADKHQTIEYKRKKEEYFRFTQFSNNNKWKKEFLKKNNITYFYYDKQQKLPYDINFNQLTFLEKIFENDEIAIYRIKTL